MNHHLCQHMHPKGYKVNIHVLENHDINMDLVKCLDLTALLSMLMYQI